MLDERPAVPTSKDVEIWLSKLHYFDRRKFVLRDRVENRPTIKPGTLTPTGAFIGSVGISNVLSEEKKQHVIALGKLGWSLRRIQQLTDVRRETASAYLKAAGVEVRLPGG